MAAAMRPSMRMLKLRGFPILQQLQLEERLLRTTEDNWCIFNDGTLPPSIVMGISGNPEALLDLEAVARDRISVIRRFSGGGTVIVDDNTLFVTLICSRDAVPKIPLFPGRIMEWTQEFYDIVFKTVPGFELREHDYAIGQRKFAGNAQAIIKDRWLHHTSFLWDYNAILMGYLSVPSRAPAYRLGRSHVDFICRLKDFLPSRELFVDYLETGLQHYFSLQPSSLDEIDQTREDYPHSTKVVPLSELESLCRAAAKENVNNGKLITAKEL